MAKRVKNEGLSACKSPAGISVRTMEWGAEVCVSREGNALSIAVFHDGNMDAPSVEFTVPLTDNPYIFNPNKPAADTMDNASIDREIERALGAPTRKIVINNCFGGFSLSEPARALLRVRGVIADIECDIECDIERDNPHLIDIVEILGETAWGRHAELKIVEIPADVKWEIVEYDGLERIVEKHRTWC